MWWWLLVFVETPALPADHLPVPAVRQSTSYSCGPAALLGVLRYWQAFDGRERDLYKPLGTTKIDGTDPQPIADFARKKGLFAEYRHDVRLEELRDALARRQTVILDLQAWHGEGAVDWATDWDDGHYVVLVAMDDRYVYVMDPSAEGGYAYLPIAEFLARWHDVEGRSTRLSHMAIFVSGPRRPLVRME